MKRMDCAKLDQLMFAANLFCVGGVKINRHQSTMGLVNPLDLSI